MSYRFEGNPDFNHKLEKGFWNYIVGYELYFQSKFFLKIEKDKSVLTKIKKISSYRAIPKPLWYSVSNHFSSIPKINKATYSTPSDRIAIVGICWSTVKAVDIFVLFQSFLPENGSLICVNIYPSEYGLIKSKEEFIKGPNYVNNRLDLAGSADSSSENISFHMTKSQLNEKHLLHDKTKTLWYFAIAEFDSISTSNFVYLACDGLEFGPKSNVLDLRFVPSTINFSRLISKDMARAIPPIYNKPSHKFRANSKRAKVKTAPLTNKKEIDAICLDSALVSEQDFVPRY